MTTRLADLRSRLQQLEALQRSGELTTTAYDDARATLEREIVALVMAGDADSATPSSLPAGLTPTAAAERAGDELSPPTVRPSRRLLASLSVAVVALAALGYAVTGAPGLARLQAFGPPPAQAGAAAPQGGDQPQVTREQIEAMVQRLAQRMKERPDDAQGWLMLARAYTVLDRPDEALPAYARAASLRPDDATTLADYADAIALHNGGHADAQSNALIAKALTLAPDNIKALALAGTAAFERADYAGAVSQWQKMAQSMAPDDPDRPRVDASIAEARQRGGLAPMEGTSVSASPSTPTTGDASRMAPAAPSAKPEAGVKNTSVSGTVSLAPSLAARASPDDTVFIFARAAQGPRMPLAVLRAHVKDLPMSYTLDDSMAMAPTAKLSGAAQVVVGARISKTGNAMPQVGDLAGESAPVVPGASNVAITIATPVGP